MLTITHWAGRRLQVGPDKPFPSTAVVDVPGKGRIVVKGGGGMKRIQSYLSALGQHGTEFVAISGRRAVAGQADVFERGNVQNFGSLDPVSGEIMFSEEPQPLPEGEEYLAALIRTLGGPYPIPEAKQARICDECQSDISHRGNRATKCFRHARLADRKRRRDKRLGTKPTVERVEDAGYV